jgi:hypothetical protein
LTFRYLRDFFCQQVRRKSPVLDAVFLTMALKVFIILSVLKHSHIAGVNAGMFSGGRVILGGFQDGRFFIHMTVM